MTRSAALILLLASAAGCGRASPVGLWVVPDRLTLLGPGHARTIAVYEGATPIAAADLRTNISDSRIADVHGLRIRALQPGAARVEITSKDGATGAVDLEVRQEVMPFIQSIVDQTRGKGDGFGRDRLPDVILGPPRGAGQFQGSTDVLSLGIGGSITVSFAPLRIYDGPGPDFIVFENAFQIANTDMTDAEPGIVEAALGDGAFSKFDCEDRAWPFSGCAGVRPVLAGPGAPDVDATDPERAGGDDFDLEHHLPLADRVRITDVGTGPVTANGTSGFDLDAIAIVHALPDDARSLDPSPASIALSSGRSMPAPRADVARADGSMIFGIAVKRTLSTTVAASLDGDLLHALRPGTCSLILSAGVLTATVSIQVTP